MAATTQQNAQQATKKQISPQQRAALFGMATRQNLQMLPTQQVTAENTTIQFTFPKTRLFSKAYLNIDATVLLKSNAATITKNPVNPFGILRRVSLDLNNGFTPYVIGGRELGFYNVLRDNPTMFTQQGSSVKSAVYQDNAASVAGTTGRIKFTLPISVVLNDRDPVGLILLQNNETNVTLTIDVALLANAYTINSGNADQVIFQSMKITPMMETFSIPSHPDAFPDLSVIKLVNSKRDIVNTGAQTIVKLNTGLIYRKLLFYFEDGSGNPLTDDSFAGNIELIFNQSDIPISIRPDLLSHLNHFQFKQTMLPGLYALDFSFQGISNYGGSRDYIDTESLTEFWLRFTNNTGGFVTTVSETLARLR